MSSIADRPTVAGLLSLADAAQEHRLPNLDPATADAARTIASSVGELDLTLTTRTGSIEFRGWFSRGAAVLASPIAGPDSPARLAVMSIEKLANRIARLVALGPRPDYLESGQALIPPGAIERICSAADPPTLTTASASLEIPDGALGGWVDGLVDRRTAVWRLSSHSTLDTDGEAIDLDLEVVDVPDSRVWMKLGTTIDGETILSAATPRIVWIGLTSVLPCWNGLETFASARASK